MAAIDFEVFDTEIGEVIRLIEFNDEAAAAKRFGPLYDRYEPLLTAASSPLLLFFIELNEYLYNEGTRILGQTSRERILELYESGYPEDLRLAREQHTKGSLQ